MNSPITGIILAGGLGRRMGNVDKGLQLLRGKPMVQHVLERFAPQVDEVLINANRNPDNGDKHDDVDESQLPFRPEVPTCYEVFVSHDIRTVMT